MNTSKSNDLTVIKALVVLCTCAYAIAFFQSTVISFILGIPIGISFYYLGREIYKDIKSQFNNAWPVDLAAVKFITWASTM